LCPFLESLYPIPDYANEKTIIFPRKRHKPPFSTVKRSSPLLFYKTTVARGLIWFWIAQVCKAISLRLSFKTL
jgi:hypothetical protein